MAGSSCSFSGMTTAPWASMRSVISNRQRRGTSTAGASWNRSYRSTREERRSSSRSRKPLVPMKPARAPLCSSRALVTTVVAWARSETPAGSIPCWARPWPMPRNTAWPKSCGVVRTLAIPMRPLSSSTRATSVKVPPMSMPIRQAMSRSPSVWFNCGPRFRPAFVGSACAPDRCCGVSFAIWRLDASVWMIGLARYGGGLVWRPGRQMPRVGGFRPGPFHEIRCTWAEV